jgi:hypothetical protein
VLVQIESDPITLGTLIPDGTGTVTGSFTVPSTLAAGTHTLVLSGTGANGQPRTVSLPLTVTAAASSAANSGIGTGTTSTPLALTGAQSKALFWFGVVVALIGAALTRLARQRRLES